MTSYAEWQTESCLESVTTTRKVPTWIHHHSILIFADIWHIHTHTNRLAKCLTIKKLKKNTKKKNERTENINQLISVQMKTDYKIMISYKYKIICRTKFVLHLICVKYNFKKNSSAKKKIKKKRNVKSRCLHTHTQTHTHFL